MEFGAGVLERRGGLLERVEFGLKTLRLLREALERATKATEGPHEVIDTPGHVGRTSVEPVQARALGTQSCLEAPCSQCELTGAILEPPQASRKLLGASLSCLQSIGKRTQTVTERHGT